MKIYKSCSPKYTNEQIQHLSGTVSFVSWERLLVDSINQAIRKTEKEKIVGMEIDEDGVKVYIETEHA